MDYRVSYPINIWLLSAFIGSTLFYWGTGIFDPGPIHGDSFKDGLAFYLLTFIVSLLFSIPALLLLWLSVYLLSKTRMSLQFMRGILSFISVVLCTLSFAMLPQFSFNIKDLIAVVCYSVPLVAGVYYFKLRW